MKYQDAAAFRAALETRLNRSAAGKGSQALSRLRKMVVFERILARLLVAAPDRWILKGGVALDLRLGERARLTRDLDLGRFDSEDAATRDLLAAGVVQLGDFLTFIVERNDALDALEEGVAVRYHLCAEMEGRRFETVVLDVGFSAPLPDSPDALPGPDFLVFAGISPIEVPTIPLEYHIAEKLHAYTQIYGDGRQSTRVKDLIDILLIQSASAFEAGRMRRAFRHTFADRADVSLPSALSLPPATWTSRYAKLAAEVALNPDLATGHRLAAAFLDGVLNRSLDDAARWDPASGAWAPPAG